MATAGPPETVSAPRPQPARWNLFTVAQAIPPEAPERWLNGVSVWPFPAGPGDGWDPCGEGTFRPKAAGDDLALPEFNAFVAYIAETCSSFSARDWAEFMGRADAALAAVEPFHAERQLATGDYLLFNSQPNPYLADSNADVLGSLGEVAALVALENAIADTGKAGVIHATPGTVTAWAAESLLLVEGGALRTYVGTPVVSGAGYRGARPVNEAAPSATAEWAFATGPVLYGRGNVVRANPPTLAEALDRSDNTITYRAERDLLVAWDMQLQAAVLVDRS